MKCYKRTRPAARSRGAMLAAFATMLLGGSQVGVAVEAPRPPRAYVDTTYHPPRRAKTWQVRAGGDLQRAINAAQPGEIIEIEAGAKFVGKFVLPRKQGSGWICIRSSRHAELPPEGTRVTPADAHRMPKLVARPDEGWVISTDFAASNYRLVGIEITKEVGNSFTAQLVNLGRDTAGRPATSVDQLPRNIILDRVYVHGTPRDSTLEGIRIDGTNVAICDSYVSDVHAIGNGDTQAILCINGAGPFKIVNNYLEAAGENVMFGGSDPTIRVSTGGISREHPAVNCVADPGDPNASVCGLVPSDVEIRGNHFFKPLSWNKADPSFGGLQWGAKNLFELKNVQRIWVEGNIFQNSWTHAQTGWAIMLTPRNQDRTAPWSTIQDLTFVNNVITNAVGGIAMLPTDNSPGSGSDNVKRCLVRNNLLEQIGSTIFEIANSGKPGFTPARDIVIEHNTGLHSGPARAFFVVGDSTPVVHGFVFGNNLVTNGQYGFFGSGAGAGPEGVMKQYFRDYKYEKNVVIPRADANRFGFANFEQGDYRLANGSPYQKAGTDGQDIGVDMNALRAATVGAILGRREIQEEPAAKKNRQ